MSLEVLRLWHTMRWLRPQQVWGRLRFKLVKPRPDLRPPPPVRNVKPGWRICARIDSMTGPVKFRFLNVERQLASPADWNRSDWPKLWLYNLHYFDDLVADHAMQRTAWHRALIARWIAENPPGMGNGWEPYPVSLRLVNWIKWALHGNDFGAEVTQSAAVQCRWLYRRLETHLLGNHLWANAKALIFAGTYFESAEAELWRERGLSLLRQELREQILGDGGHFERSPMYHAILLQDLLDLIQVATKSLDIFAVSDVTAWRNSVIRMFRWLKIMTHPDGGIAFFNDSAVGIAPTYLQLHEYARSLGIECASDEDNSIEALPDTGYVRLHAGSAVVIADVGPIGPDYLPGHAHADTLSFELSWHRNRVLTNSGTSTYEVGPVRAWERATSAHNTVVVDEVDSSEMWKAFRVARRARPFGVRAFADSTGVVVEGSHDGFRRLSGRPMHRRRVELRESELLIHDWITGEGDHSIAGYMHVHPEIRVEQDSESSVYLHLPRARLRLFSDDVPLTIEPGYFCPEFGKRLPRPVIVWRRSGHLPLSCEVRIAEAG